uniref:Uncharacterized protein n=1 Tax=Balaenoptera musculus TaxID=9771 RepID=A0A8C0DB96_BALMU
MAGKSTWICGIEKREPQEAAGREHFHLDITSYELFLLRLHGSGCRGPCSGATHPPGDRPDMVSRLDQGSGSLARGYCSRRSSRAHGRRAPRG